MLKGCPPLSIYLLHLETHFGDILNNPSSIPTFFFHFLAAGYKIRKKKALNFFRVGGGFYWLLHQIVLKLG